LLCVDERLPSKLISIFPDFETIVIVISGNPTLTICLSYKPPNASKEVMEGLFFYNWKCGQ